MNSFTYEETKKLCIGRTYSLTYERTNLLRLIQHAQQSVGMVPCYLMWVVCTYRLECPT